MLPGRDGRPGTPISERCVIDSDTETGWALSSELYRAYTQWCEDSGEKPLPKRMLGLRLAERGYAADRAGHARSRGWRGLRLVPEPDLTL